MLSSMVMLGINRIVVTDGSINAKVIFDFMAGDQRSARHAPRSTTRRSRTATSRRLRQRPAGAARRASTSIATSSAMWRRWRRRSTRPPSKAEVKAKLWRGPRQLQERLPPDGEDGDARDDGDDPGQLDAVRPEPAATPSAHGAAPRRSRARAATRRGRRPAPMDGASLSRFASPTPGAGAVPGYCGRRPRPPRAPSDIRLPDTGVRPPRHLERPSRAAADALLGVRA